MNDPQTVDVLQEDLTRARARRDEYRAEAARLREALVRIYQSGKGCHVEIARAALDNEEVDR